VAVELSFSFKTLPALLVTVIHTRLCYNSVILQCSLLYFLAVSSAMPSGVRFSICFSLLALLNLLLLQRPLVRNHPGRPVPEETTLNFYGAGED